MRNVLCVDVGATRIKAAVINNNLSSRELATCRVYQQRTLGWLNETLPKILSGHWASLDKRMPEKFDCAAIAVPGRIVNNQFERTDLTVPKGNCEVKIINDAEAWLRGSLQYLRLRSQEIYYPYISLALGTGVGLAGATIANRVESIEISQLPNRFSNLAIAAGREINASWHVHGIIGKKFFEWADEKHKSDWSYDRVRSEFTERLWAFLEDLQVLLPQQYRGTKTYVFGGGHSEYVQRDVLENKRIGKIITLNNYTLDVNPDLISLLGLMSLYVSPSS
jgi:hypothetical protein